MVWASEPRLGGGSTFNRFRTNNEQATISGAGNINVTQNESRFERGFPCGTRPIGEPADSLINSSINTDETDCCIYLNNNLQTLVSKRMCHLLKHAAHTEKVSMTAQGYVDIADLITWLNRDEKVQVNFGRHH